MVGSALEALDAAFKRLHYLHHQSCNLTSPRAQVDSWGSVQLYMVIFPPPDLHAIMSPRGSLMCHVPVVWLLLVTMRPCLAAKAVQSSIDICCMF